MKPSSMPSCFYSLLLVLSLCISYAISIHSSSSVSYTGHCSSIVPETSATGRSYTFALPYLSATHLSGGERIFGKTSSSNQSSNYVTKGLRFPIAPVYYETEEKGIYKVEAYLYIRTPSRIYQNIRGNYTYGLSYRPRNISRRSSLIRFSLNGFWSDATRRLCMVGSASWQVEVGKLLNLDAVLNLKYASHEAPTIFDSFISGTLESLGSTKDSGYFDPISILSFTVIPDYKYSLTNETDREFASEISKNASHSLLPSQFCSVLSPGSTLSELEYPTDCKHCSPVVEGDGYLPKFVSLYPIQCSWDERKLRYIVTFQNVGYAALYHSFNLNSTLVAEGSWDDENNQLLIIACRIVNASGLGKYAVDDCSIRMSMRYPSILTIRNSAAIIGRIWTNRTISDPGYFSQINLTSSDDMVGFFPGSAYVYTELDRARLSCPLKNLKKKEGIYPDGHSYDMRFDMSVRNSKGELFAWGFARPLSVGGEFYERSPSFAAMAPESDLGTSETEKSSEAPLNISYLITISPYGYNAKFGNWFPTANWSMNPRQQLTIVAEGMYDGRTGYLCMLGCRKLSSLFRKSIEDPRDCQILVNINFAPLNDRKGGRIKGTIKSMRNKTDHLYFEEFSMSSAAYYHGVAERSIWRMDLEIILVLASNTLLCLFIGLQLFHVKRNPEVISGISLVMLVLLALGLMIPLVLNFEALFLGNHGKQEVWFSNGGWLETNEVAVRVVLMVAFLLQLRLLQLVWTSKTSDGNDKGSWGGEKRAALFTLPLYVLGAVLTLLLNRSRNRHNNPYGGFPKYSLWGTLRSYGGLVLDGFLLPQILLNVFRGSPEKALSHPFYVGTSMIRVVPHAYDLYRAHNYPASFVNGTYYYANPGADFYSTAWDVIIPCGIIALAVVIFLQQRRGGRCILPKRFRELELYEKVAVVENES